MTRCPNAHAAGVHVPGAIRGMDINTTNGPHRH